MNVGHEHEAWQVQPSAMGGLYCAACGAQGLVRQASGGYLTREQVEMHLVIKDVYSAHEPNMHVMTPVNRARVVDALINAGYVKGGK